MVFTHINQKKYVQNEIRQKSSEEFLKKKKKKN